MLREFPHYISPLIDYLSKLNGRGTSYKFFKQIISLFFPPNSKGPKLIFPVSKKMFGSSTLPTIKKC
jgi:hypothetical protein